MSTLLSFIWFYIRHPRQRFWQCLLNWQRTFSYNYENPLASIEFKHYIGNDEFEYKDTYEFK